jgi:hypothetical protein
MAEHKWQAKNKGEEKAIAEHIALQKAKDAKDAKDAKIPSGKGVKHTSYWPED